MKSSGFVLEGLECRRMLSAAVNPVVFSTSAAGADVHLRDSGVLYVKATNGNDNIYIDNSSGGVFVDINFAVGGSVFKAGEAKAVLLDAGDGDDSITIQSGITIPITVNGGNGNDTIINSSSGNDLFLGQAGSDSITDDGNGNNIIVGGVGRDTLTGGSGTDVLFGDLGNDTFQPRSDHTSLVGGGGSDKVLSEGPPPVVFTSETIDATANIYGAGHSTPPGTGGGGEGILPPEFDFPAGETVLRFSSVTGTVSLSGAVSALDHDDPDAAGSSSNYGFPISTFVALDGLSGISAPGHGWIAGVFESDAEPSGTAPPALNFNTTGTNFTSLSPELNQLFFVGDGLTGDGTGAVQQFYIPAGATRLYLGIADFASNGIVGYYSDNFGNFTASFEVS